MNNKLIITAIIVLLLGSCSFPIYLPSSQNIDVNEFGSYIRITKYSGGYLRGELIAIDSSNIVVLTAEPRECVILDRSDMKSFSLRYAAGKNYGWTIPLYSLATISHGWFLILTFPANLITTLSVTASGRKAFVYTEREIPPESLTMFARFPQGIPSEIDIASIR
jgi:hypothetical protein